MHPKLFPPGFQLVATVLLAIVIPIIAATPSPAQLSPRGVDIRDLKPPNLDGWAGLGCYTDDPNQPTLTSEFFSDPPMTAWHCYNLCHAFFNELSGTVNGTYCRCGNVTTATATTVSPSLCSIPCEVPYNDQNCGGINAIAIYGSDQRQQFPAAIPQNVGPWTFQGCFNDNDTARTLPMNQTVIGGGFNNTLENCMYACGTAGYYYAGMENGKDCWCDNQINQGRTPINSRACMLPCPGDNREICGGPETLVIYRQDKREGSGP